MIKSLKRNGAKLFLVMLLAFGSLGAATVAVLANVSPQNSVAYADDWKKTKGKWWYQIESGYAKGWKQIDDEWYYFDKDGWMQTGWVQDGKKKYYLDAKGVMTTGWQLVDDEWYYMNGSGVLQSNKWIDDYWVDSDGVMATNTWVDENQYWVGDNGLWAENTLLPGDEIEPVTQNLWYVTEVTETGIEGYELIATPSKKNSLEFKDDGTYRFQLDGSTYSGVWRCYNTIGTDIIRYYELCQDGEQLWHACFFATSTIPNALIVSDRVDSEHKLYFESVSGTAKSEDNASDSIVQHDWYGTKVRSKSASSWTNIDAPSDANSIRFTNRGTYRLKINGSLNSGTWIFKSEADGERLYELNSYADDAAYIATLDVVNDELIVSGVGSNAGNDMICKIGWLSGEFAA